MASAILKGRAEATRDLAKAMLAEGDSVEKVARCSGLTLEEVRALQSSLQHA